MSDLKIYTITFTPGGQPMRVVSEYEFNKLRAKNSLMKSVVDAGRQAIEDAYVPDNVDEQCCGLCDLKIALKALDGEKDDEEKT